MECRPGILTESGQLYQGNWKQWQSRMLSVLEREVARFISLDGRQNLSDQETWSRYSHQQRKTAADILRFTIDASLRRRIPMEAWDDAAVLMQHLVPLLRPFRLLDLPPELRLIIYSWDLRGYGLFFNPRATGHALSFMSIARDWADFFPHPLLHVCTALRQEFAPEFYSHLPIELNRDAGDRPERASISGILRSWTRDIAGPWTQHLTRISICDAIAADDDAPEWYRVDLRVDASGNVQTIGIIHVATNVLVHEAAERMVARYNKQHRDLGAREGSLLVEVALDVVNSCDPRDHPDWRYA